MGRIFSIIPAAGRSNRMGRPKQLLDISGRPMLLAVVDPIAASALVQDVVVVTNSLVAPSLNLDQPKVRVVINDDPKTDMIDSLRKALTHLQEQEGLVDSDGVLICPGDQPGLSVDDIELCCQTFLRNQDRIVIATHQGKRGHPLIFPASMVPLVMSDACANGLRSLPQAHDDRVVTTECQSDAVLRNVNSPDDYDRLPPA